MKHTSPHLKQYPDIMREMHCDSGGMKGTLVPRWTGRVVGYGESGV